MSFRRMSHLLFDTFIPSRACHACYFPCSAEGSCATNCFTCIHMSHVHASTLRLSESTSPTAPWHLPATIQSSHHGRSNPVCNVLEQSLAKRFDSHAFVAHASTSFMHTFSCHCAHPAPIILLLHRNASPPMDCLAAATCLSCVVTKSNRTPVTVTGQHKKAK